MRRVYTPTQTDPRERERERESARWSDPHYYYLVYIYIRYVAATGVVLISKGFSFFSYVILKQEAKRNLLLFVDLLSSVLPIPSHCHPPNKQQSQQYWDYLTIQLDCHYQSKSKRERERINTSTAALHSSVRRIVIQSPKKKKLRRIRKALARSLTCTHTL